MKHLPAKNHKLSLLLLIAISLGACTKKMALLRQTEQVAYQQEMPNNATQPYGNPAKQNSNPISDQQNNTNGEVIVSQKAGKAPAIASGVPELKKPEASKGLKMASKESRAFTHVIPL